MSGDGLEDILLRGEQRVEQERRGCHGDGLDDVLVHGIPREDARAGERVLPGSVRPEDAEVRGGGGLPGCASRDEGFPPPPESREVVEGDGPREDDPVVLHQGAADPHGRPAGSDAELDGLPVGVRLFHADAGGDLRPDDREEFPIREGAMGPSCDEDGHPVPRDFCGIGFLENGREEPLRRGVARDVRHGDGDRVRRAEKHPEGQGSDGASHPLANQMVLGGREERRPDSQPVDAPEDLFRQDLLCFPVFQGDRTFRHLSLPPGGGASWCSWTCTISGCSCSWICQ